MSQFAVSNKYMNPTQDFVQSTSVVAQVSFVLLVVVGFIFALHVGIGVLGWLFQPSSKTILVNGLVDGQTLIVIPQDPASPNAKPISRSNNEDEGIEFTWSVWLNLSDKQNNPEQYKCIFYKGDDTVPSDNGMNTVSNAPGLYLLPNSNTLQVVMNTFQVINETIDIPNIPLNKWINVMIRCEQQTLDVYINGTIAKSHVLHGVPKQNWGSVYVSPYGGFQGYLSNLTYQSKAVSPIEMSSLVIKGPNLTAVGSILDIQKVPNNFLSSRWYFGSV